MSTLKVHAELAALRDAALEDLMATSDAELRQEAVEGGDDLDAIALQIKSAMRETAAATLRQNLVLAKARLPQKINTWAASLDRPSLEQIKQIVQSVFKADASLGLAFRNGTKQTDEDWLSLYDDLIAIGAIKPDTHGN
jgi:hypothetical protein